MKKKKKQLKAAQRAKKKQKKLARRKARKVQKFNIRKAAANNIALWNKVRTIKSKPLQDMYDTFGYGKDWNIGDVYDTNLDSYTDEQLKEMASPVFLFDDETSKKEQIRFMLTNPDRDSGGKAWLVLKMEEQTGTNQYSSYVNAVLVKLYDLDYWELMNVMSDPEFQNEFKDPNEYWKTIQEGLDALYQLDTIIDRYQGVSED